MKTLTEYIWDKDAFTPNQRILLNASHTNPVHPLTVIGYNCIQNIRQRPEI